MNRILFFLLFLPSLIMAQGISIGDKPLSGGNTPAGADWNVNLENIPAGFADGVDNDTQLDASQVRAFYDNMVAIVSQGDAEAGTSTTVYRWTPQRIKQAIDALAPVSGGSWNHVAISDIAMSDFDITNIGELYINGTSTDNDDFIFGRSDSGSYFYDEDAYNNLVKGRFDISAATGKGSFEGDFNINGVFTVNGIALGSALGEENATSTRNAVLTDADGLVNVDSASDVTITIPANATTAFPIGTVLTYFQEGAGDVIISYSGGVTGDEARTFNTGHKIVLWKTGTDVWQVISRPASALVTSAEYSALSTGLKNNGTLYGTSD
ncbi:hypothetical protein [Flagellimonas sp.]|uniref:hypothetical protein n=1 Tax=Flagellimonas sp. TaxID=2058762 RepID=UPI003BA9D202